LKTFRVILFTDRQTDNATDRVDYITSLAEVQLSTAGCALLSCMYTYND